MASLVLEPEKGPERQEWVSPTSARDSQRRSVSDSGLVKKDSSSTDVSTTDLTITNVTSNQMNSVSDSNESEPVQVAPNEMIVVYESSEFGDDDLEQATSGLLLVKLTCLFKLVMVSLPTVVVVLVIVGRLEGDSDARLKERVFRGVGILSLIAGALLVYHFLRHGLCEELLFESQRRGDLLRAQERQRHREELKLQARDPWKRTLVAQPKKPYFNHVELYAQTGLYKENGARF